MELRVIPDSPVGEHVAGPLVVQDDVQVVRHPSGRPWVVGRWRADKVVLADEADRVSRSGLSLTRVTHGTRGVPCVLTT